MSDWQHAGPLGFDKLSPCGARHPDGWRCLLGKRHGGEHFASMWRRGDESRGHEMRTFLWAELEKQE
jgi:hypothetical protein